MPPKKKGGKKRKAAEEEKYTLVYFDLEGLAEVSRLLFAVSQVEFEDKRYPFEQKDGKPHRPEWDADKSDTKKFPFAKIPVLNIGEDTVIPQTRAIENYLAKKFGLYGKGPVEAAHIDAIAEYFKDIASSWRDHKVKGDEDIKKFFTTALPELYGHLERLLTENKSGYFVGKKPTLADIIAYRVLNSYWAPDHKNQADEALKAFPQLAKLHETVGNLEGIKDYHAKKNKAKEPKTDAAPQESTDKSQSS